MEDHLGGLIIDGRIIIKINLQEVGCESVKWINLTQDRGHWWALANMVMNLWMS
jgi:hypothetical protein